MFIRVNNPICPECEKAEEVAFQKLKDYLNDNPGQSMALASQETGVPLKRILRYLREGRLELTPGFAADNPLRCERCGMSIKVGTLCDECLKQYNQAVQGLKEGGEQSRLGSGMHSIPKDGIKRR